MLMKVMITSVTMNSMIRWTILEEARRKFSGRAADRYAARDSEPMFTTSAAPWSGRLPRASLLAGAPATSARTRHDSYYPYYDTFLGVQV
jgi:hypothetical protein